MQTFGRKTQSSELEFRYLESGLLQTWKQLCIIRSQGTFFFLFLYDRKKKTSLSILNKPLLPVVMIRRSFVAIYSSIVKTSINSSGKPVCCVTDNPFYSQAAESLETLSKNNSVKTTVFVDCRIIWTFGQSFRILLIVGLPGLSDNHSGDRWLGGNGWGGWVGGPSRSLI